MAKRVKMARQKGGWRRDHPDAVIVARPSKWGNPFRVGDYGIPDADEAVRRFRAAVMGFTLDGAFCPPRAHPDSYIGRIIRARAPEDAEKAWTDLLREEWVKGLEEGMKFAAREMKRSRTNE